MSASDQSDFSFSLEQIPWEETAPGLRVKARQVGAYCFRLLEFTSAFRELDWCMTGHRGYVLSGEIVVNIEGSLVTFKKDDMVNIPSNTRHKHHSTNQTARLFVIEETDKSELPTKPNTGTSRS